MDKSSSTWIQTIKIDNVTSGSAYRSSSPERKYSIANGSQNPHKYVERLLLGKTPKHYFVFNPDSAQISLINKQEADLVEAAQSGKELSDDHQAVLNDRYSSAVNSDIANDQTPNPVWGIALHLNHACNLACEYCYADGRTSDADGLDKGTYGGPISFMGTDVMKNALDKFMNNAPSERVVVVIWGGEPLLSERRFLEAVDIVNEYADAYKKQVTFQITTNGTKFTDKVLTYFKKYKFSIVVSMDGGEETQSTQRPMHAGMSSYSRVIAGLDKLRAENIEFSLRGTAVRGRTSYVDDYEYLANQTSKTTTIQFHMYGKDAISEITKTEQDEIFELYKNTAIKILQGDVISTKYDSVRNTLKSILTHSKKQYQCGAGRWYSAVGCDGDVFPCHRFVGMSPYTLGNVTNVDFQFSANSLFESNNVAQRNTRKNGARNCNNCYAKNVCGGGCAQIGAANSETISELPSFYCQETRLRVNAVCSAIVEASST